MNIENVSLTIMAALNLTSMVQDHLKSILNFVRNASEFFILLEHMFSMELMNVSVTKLDLQVKFVIQLEVNALVRKMLWEELVIVVHLELGVLKDKMAVLVNTKRFLQNDIRL